MRRRLTCSPGTLIAAVAVYVVVGLNGSFWRQLFAGARTGDSTDWVFLLAIGIVITAVVVVVLSVVAVPFLLKPVAAVLVAVSAVVSCFASEYGIAIDVNMIRNVLETDVGEVADLVNGRLVATVLIWGMLPALLIAAAPIAWRPLRSTALSNVVRGGFACALAGSLLLAFQPRFAALASPATGVHLHLIPSNLIVAGVQYLRSKEPLTPARVQPFGADARRSTAHGRADRPLVTILVVGETARAANFSIYGYDRQTNPRLAETEGVIRIRQATSCGTDTAHSLPCMFSGLGRDGFSSRKASSQENLLDIVKRTGLGVLWRDNQAGCKGVCRRVETEMLSERKDPEHCGSGECHDEILLDALDQKVRAMTEGGLIALLRKFDTMPVDVAMLYAADHGESLGERGRYLHGMPWLLAPKEQIEIPMLLWLSSSTRALLGLDSGCLARRADRDIFSHDNLFHTILGLFDIRTSTYDPRQDILAPCLPRDRVKA